MHLAQQAPVGAALPLQLANLLLRPLLLVRQPSRDLLLLALHPALQHGQLLQDPLELALLQRLGALRLRLALAQLGGAGADQLATARFLQLQVLPGALQRALRLLQLLPERSRAADGRCCRHRCCHLWRKERNWSTRYRPTIDDGGGGGGGGGHDGRIKSVPSLYKILSN